MTIIVHMHNYCKHCNSFIPLGQPIWPPERLWVCSVRKRLMNFLSLWCQRDIYCLRIWRMNVKEKPDFVERGNVGSDNVALEKFLDLHALSLSFVLHAASIWNGIHKDSFRTGSMSTFYFSCPTGLPVSNSPTIINASKDWKVQIHKLVDHFSFGKASHPRIH